MKRQTLQQQNRELRKIAFNLQKKIELLDGCLIALEQRLSDAESDKSITLSRKLEFKWDKTAPDPIVVTTEVQLKNNVKVVYSAKLSHSVIDDYHTRDTGSFVIERDCNNKIIDRWTREMPL